MLTIICQRLMRKGLSVLLASRRCLRIRAKKDIVYFAYGANMNASILDCLGLDFSLIGVARLNDWALTIDVPCEYLGVGYASVIPKIGSSVFGVLYRLDSLSFAQLRVAEWAPFGFYKVAQDRVEAITGEIFLETKFFIAGYPRDGLSVPEEYKLALISSATVFNFPSGYIEDLIGLSTREPIVLDHEFNLFAPGKRRIFFSRFPRLVQINDLIREWLSKRI